MRAIWTTHFESDKPIITAYQSTVLTALEAANCKTYQSTFASAFISAFKSTICSTFFAAHATT